MGGICEKPENLKKIETRNKPILTTTARLLKFLREIMRKDGLDILKLSEYSEVKKRRRKQ